MTVAIEVEDLHVKGDGARLRGASLQVRPGERVAVVGRHQPSLSLLIRACAGFESVQRGRVRVCDVDVAQADRRGLLQLRRKLGYVSISGGLLANMTMRDNLELALRYHGVSPDEASQRVRARIDASGLTAHADARGCMLPAELLKCFAYLRALLCDPTVLLAEDPSAFLHPQGRRVVADLHAEAHERGITVLIADDDIDFVTPMVDRVIDWDAMEASG